MTIASITESVNPATAAIDTLSTRMIVAAIQAEDAKVAAAVAAVGDAIAQLVDVATERMRRGGRLIYVGAGTSGRLGVLDAAECPPTFSTQAGQVIGLIAGGAAALTQAIEGIEDDPERGRGDVAGIGVGADDTVLGIAASGRTPYVLGAIAEARARGAFVAGLACTRPSALAEAVDVMIAPIVGPEVVAGSTRMKAGTAQKLVLNTLSTAIMIRLGKTFGNLMVDVQPLNEKLRQRTVQIVAAATGLGHEEARALLARAGGQPKTAIVMARANVDAQEAQRRLLESGGHVRAALSL
ncbi:MAG: N-acetylmuramic acid 6-phosphate etherase [Roseiflexaceae bacterium]